MRGTHIEAGARRPHAVALGVEDGGLVEVAGADQAVALLVCCLLLYGCLGGGRRWPRRERGAAYLWSTYAAGGQRLGSLKLRGGQLTLPGHDEIVDCGERMGCGEALR